MGITYARLHPLPALRHHITAWGLMSKEGMQLVDLLAQGVDLHWFNAAKLMQEMQEVIRTENYIAFGAEVRAFVMNGLIDWNKMCPLNVRSGVDVGLPQMKQTLSTQVRFAITQ